MMRAAELAVGHEFTARFVAVSDFIYEHQSVF